MAREKRRKKRSRANAFPDPEEGRAHEHFQTRAIQPPPIVYKYVTPDTARLILSGQTLRFSSPLRFNDPFDSQWDPVWSVQTDNARACLGGMIERAMRDSSSWPAETPPARRKILEGEARRFERMSREHQAEYIADVTGKVWTSSKNARESIVKRIEDIRHGARVCCFCEDPGEILMWSHYAEDHRGVVLGFASAALESAYGRPLEPVRYHKSIPVLVDPSRWAAAAVFGLSDPAFEGEPRIWQLTKADVWKYEREWRFAWIEPANPNVLFGYFRNQKFPETSLVELVFGCKAREADVSAIKALATALNPNLQYSAMARHPERFELIRSRLAE